MTPIVYKYISTKEYHDAFPGAHRPQRTERLTEHLHSVNGVEPRQIRFSVIGRICP